MRKVFLSLLLIICIIFPTQISANKSSISTNGEKAVKVAMKFKGYKYKIANNSNNPKNGYLDCSGLTQYSYKVGAKVDIERTAHGQFCKGHGIKVYAPPKENYYEFLLHIKNLKTGDLLFFQTDHDAQIDHVGIYIGNGNMIHASSEEGQVLIVRLDKYLKNKNVIKYVGYKRF